MTQGDWHPVVRQVHLRGGLRAISKPGSEVLILPTTIKDKAATFNLRSYGDLIPHFERESLSPYGVEYFQSIEQANGVISPDWRVSIKKEYSERQTVEQSWRNITHGAHDDGNLELADLSSRIGFEILACKFRLRDLSAGYHTELRSLIFRGDFKANQWFETTNTFSIILALHSFFNEICTLRNFIAEFIAAFVFPSIESQSRIYSIKSLREKILKKVKESDSFANELWDITNDENGWLARLGSFRDLVTHLAPISRATPISCMVTKEIAKLGDNILPGVCFFLPEDLKQIESQRNQGIFLDPIEWVEKNKEKLLNPNGIDALDYAFESISKMVDLAYKLIEFSPSKPKTKVITESDIIGPIKIRSGYC